MSKEELIKFIDYLYKELLYLRRKYQELKMQVSAREKVANKYKGVIDKVVNIINECKLLMLHEYDWGEQIAYIEELLKEVANEKL